MKNIIYTIAIGLIFFTGCTGLKTTSTGLENEAFLEFIGTPSNYIGGVDVNIDDKNTFKGEVNKDHADRPKGKVYAISTGNHLITVSYNSKVIFKKQIFVSSQETKKIMLP
jgi:hypothetical protein